MSEQQTTELTPIEEKRQLIQSYEAEFAKVVPDTIGAKRFTRIALTALSKNPDLVDCDRMSLLGAIMEAAQQGLEPNTAKGHSYLVPFKGIVTYIPGYQGLKELAYDTGKVKSVRARIVYFGDGWKILQGDEERYVHEPCMEFSKRGDPIGAYAIVELVGGGVLRDFMYFEEIEETRPAHTKQGTKSYIPNTPWKNHWDEMARKTVFRRCLKYAPLSDRLSQAIHSDELASRGGSLKFDPDMGEVVDVEANPPAVEKPAEAASPEALG